MTCATFVPVFVFLGLSVLELGPMYVTDSQTSDGRASSLNASALWGRGHNKVKIKVKKMLKYKVQISQLMRYWCMPFCSAVFSIPAFGGVRTHGVAQ